VGRVVRTLPEGDAVVGVTSLANMIYVLRSKECGQIEVYDIITYRFQCCLSLPNARLFADMTSCEHFLCVYIADHGADCVHRLDVGLGLQGSITQWVVSDKPSGLSVNTAHNVIVTFSSVRKIKEFSSHGEVIRKFAFPDNVINPWHAIQLTNSQFIVCHNNHDDSIHKVCMISADGRHIVHSHGGQRGSETGQYSEPRHLAVDNHEFVFVADLNNRRVTLLSPTLNYVRQVLGRDELKGCPGRLCLDVQRRRLLVADNDCSCRKDSKRTGRVVVFSV